MLKEEEEGYMASIDAVARSAARALLGSPRPWSHLDQSLIFCFSNFTQPYLARVVSLNMIVYIKSILVTGPQGCIFQVWYICQGRALPLLTLCRLRTQFCWVCWLCVVNIWYGYFSIPCVLMLDANAWSKAPLENQMSLTDKHCCMFSLINHHHFYCISCLWYVRHCRFSCPKTRTCCPKVKGNLEYDKNAKRS